MIRLEMKNYNMILTDKLPKYQPYRQAKIDKYEYLTVEILKQAKFTYSPLGKAFEKQEKTIEDLGKKQVHTLKDLKDNKEKQIHNADDYENKLLISKERETFRNTYNKRLNKIEELDKK